MTKPYKIKRKCFIHLGNITADYNLLSYAMDDYGGVILELEDGRVLKTHISNVFIIEEKDYNTI